MATEEMKDQTLFLFAFRLRVLVLGIGECAQPAWWKTEFMNETGFRFLERLFPRTFFHAAVHAAGTAASDVHDRSVGRFGVYHLFRLPESLETEIHRMPPELDHAFYVTVRNSLGHPGKLMELLALLCAGEEVDASPGPKKIGTEKDVITAVGLRKTAAVYHSAFARKKPGFPYFTAEPVGGSG